jgi:hypothetical protein
LEKLCLCEKGIFKIEKMKLSLMQKIIKFFSSNAKFEEMMKESKQWKFKCSCGQVSSIWDIGGIRYKAGGDSTKAIRCPYCKKIGMQKLYKSES